jgi:regulator of sigma E protease
MYILLALVFFGLLIFIHELGHFIVARLCGVKVLEFAIGMGPKLLSKKSKKSGTVYSLRAIPIGGFVSMLGENGMEAVQGSGEEKDETSDERDDAAYFLGESEEKPKADPELEKHAYCNQSVWKRILISIAGPAMNVILGFLLMIVLVLCTKNYLGTTVVHSYADENISSAYGILPGDEIVKIGKTPVHTLYDLSYEISEQGYRPVDVTVIRNGERITLPGVMFPVVAQQGVAFGMQDFIVYAEPNFHIGSVLKHSFWRCCSVVKMVYDSIEGLITNRYGVEAVSGPIGITEVIGEAAKSSWLDVLHLLILISVNLGIMNLLPLPALDGGHIIMYVIEAIRRKPIKPEVEGLINFIGLILLLGLAILISIKDVIAL